MSNNDQSVYKGCSENQVLQFEPELQHDTPSFPVLQAQNNMLLTDSTTIQEQMATNRHTRLLAKKQLSESYRQLTQETADQKTQNSIQEHMQYLRQKITDLEKDHVLLHQQFIALQARFREMVRFQRQQLLNTINQTRARSTGISCAAQMVTCLSDGQSANADSSSSMNVLRKYA